MKIAILAAGAGGMYCGSCMRDNTLAAALIRAGHDVALVPLYTPLRTDEQDVSIGHVFFGGVNVYLQHATRLFRRTPRFVDWVFDRRWLLNLAGRRGASTDPARLGPLTVSTLRGDRGPQVKEVRRLVRFLADSVQPQVVTLPNALFIGVAGALRRGLGCPVVCELTGEDIFIDALPQPWRDEALGMIRDATGQVDRFVASSRYYADRMADYLAVPRERIAVVYPGIAADSAGMTPPRPANRPPTVGYLARICEEKGFDRLLAAMVRLRGRPGFESAQLRSAGWLGAAQREWYDRLTRQAAAGPLSGGYHHHGEVDRAGKIAFLHELDLLSVPTAYAEPKGIYLLEAWAAGVPAVQVAHGAFPELIEATGGGVLVPPGDETALADALADLLTDHDRRLRLGQAARSAVLARFTDAHMAGAMLKVFEEAIAPAGE
ncbi:MAG: D-inositol-3-phosphate glycosyltransferase [Phycisphaerae bacterium]|nr:D-inositol-3-phosphate glycosyltransferase [Phycisphaerae bacterium]